MVVLRRRDALSRDCKVMLFVHEVRMGESIDFQIPMKSACTAGVTPASPWVGTVRSPYSAAALLMYQRASPSFHLQARDRMLEERVLQNTTWHRHLFTWKHKTRHMRSLCSPQTSNCS
jgi:hypothetical protein